MDGICSTYGIDENCMKVCSQKSGRKDKLGDVSVNGRIMLRSS
jgi:hypothetical protein